jgi:hypothetical protein
VLTQAKVVILGCSLAKAAREVPPGLLPRIILTAPLSHASRAGGDGQARRVFVPVARRADELKIRPNIGAFLAARLTGEQGSISESRTSSGQRSILTVDQHTAEAGIAHLGKGYFLRSAGEGGHAAIEAPALGPRNRSRANGACGRIDHAGLVVGGVMFSKSRFVPPVSMVPAPIVFQKS